MNKHAPIFEIKIEDYSQKRWKSAVKAAYGTLDEIYDLIIPLGFDGQLYTRYKETVDAYEDYNRSGIMRNHTVAGQSFPIVTHTREIAHCEFTLQNKYWDYCADNEVAHFCRASEIQVYQMLLEIDDRYVMCARANFVGLEIYAPGVGWIHPSNNIQGFPHMVTYSDNTYRMTLAVAEGEYCEHTLDLALENITDPEAVDLACLVADILGEG